MVDGQRRLRRHATPARMKWYGFYRTVRMSVRFGFTDAGMVSSLLSSYGG